MLVPANSESAVKIDLPTSQREMTPESRSATLAGVEEELDFQYLFEASLVRNDQC